MRDFRDAAAFMRRTVLLSAMASGVAFCIPVGAQQPLFRVEEQQLISWAFEQNSLAEARQRSHDTLKGHLAFAGAIGTLTPGQQRRLELAGHGDIERFFAQAETVISSQPKGDVPQEQYNEIWNALQPVRNRYTGGLHARGSLFEKTLQASLNPQQRQAYEGLQSARRRRAYQALVAAGVADLEKRLPLTAQQRTRLIELLMEHTTPPTVQLQDYTQFRIVLYKMSKIPEAELKPSFPELEWKMLSAMMQGAEAYGRQLERMEAAAEP